MNLTLLYLKLHLISLRKSFTNYLHFVFTSIRLSSRNFGDFFKGGWTVLASISPGDKGDRTLLQQPEHFIQFIKHGAWHTWSAWWRLRGRAWPHNQKLSFSNNYSPHPNRVTWSTGLLTCDRGNWGDVWHYSCPLTFATTCAYNLELPLMPLTC